MIPYILTALGGYLIGSSVKQYASGGQVQLLAPNGKPSNLTPEQYKLVRTPEFKAWFGDWENDPENASKVVDENGEPMVVYHATIMDFNEFRIVHKYQNQKIKINWSIGSHFGTLSQAKQIADEFPMGAFFKPYFLNIRDLQRVYDYQTWTYKDWEKNLVELGYIKGSNFSFSKIYKVIEDEKFEGFVYNNIYEGGGDSYVVLNPKSIKLADGTNTTFDGSNPDIRYAEGGEVVSNDYNTGYNRNPDVNKGGYVIFYEYEDDDNRKKVESFWNDLHRQKIAKELGIYKINYRIYEDKIIALSSLYYYTNYKSFKFTDNQISLIKELLNKYNLDFIKDYILYENEIIINFVDGFRLKKKKSLFHDEKGEYRGYPYFYENLKIEDGKKYIGKMFKEVFGRHVDVPFSYKKEIRRYNDVLKRLAENNYSTEGRRKLDLSKAKQIEKYLDKYRYLAGFKLDSTGYIIAYEPFNE